MARNFNTTKDGGSWSDEIKRAVWDKADTFPDQDPAKFRRDVCGRGIYWNDYGNRNDVWGWEIDHIKPVALGGSDDLSNLQAMQWENNASKGDTYPWKCEE